MSQERDLWTRRALRGNATFSGLSGLTLLASAHPLAEPLGAPATALQVVGLALLPFAFGLWRTARKPALDRTDYKSFK